MVEEQLRQKEPVRETLQAAAAGASYVACARSLLATRQCLSSFEELRWFFFLRFSWYPTAPLFWFALRVGFGQRGGCSGSLSPNGPSDLAPRPRQLRKNDVE